MTPFSDPEAIARYAEGPIAQVPGFLDLQKITRILLEEAVGAQGRILVLGAGGGIELLSLAEAQPGWHFQGIDPSGPMLDLARVRTQAHAGRIALHQGLIFDAPPGPFDGATCLLTLHFVPKDQRRPTLAALRRRLRPGAPLVLAHLSLPASDPVRWLDRYAAFSALNGIDPARAAEGAARIARELPVQSPEEDEADLVAAGFTGVDLVYAGLAFRGWAARA